MVDSPGNSRAGKKGGKCGGKMEYLHCQISCATKGHTIDKYTLQWPIGIYACT